MELVFNINENISSLCIFGAVDVFFYGSLSIQLISIWNDIIPTILMVFLALLII